MTPLVDDDDDDVSSRLIVLASPDLPPSSARLYDRPLSAREPQQASLFVCLPAYLSDVGRSPERLSVYLSVCPSGAHLWVHLVECRVERSMNLHD